MIPRTRSATVASRLGVILAVAIVGSLTLTGPLRSAGAQESRGSSIAAIVASFDPHATAPQRFIVGLLTAKGRQLAFGEVRLRFAYAGTRDNPLREVEAGEPMTATYRPVPGEGAVQDGKTSRVVAPSVSRGVYGVDDVVFDRPGLWGVLVSGRDGSRRFRTDAFFEVTADPQVPAVGEPAPRSANPLPGATGVNPRAIDSRARTASVPDPELHSVSVADAIARGAQTMVVVSTPVFCTSQFCGPITDSIQALARKYGDDMSFVHLEVWEDFEDRAVNDAAGEWVYPRDASEANEPWVFVVDGNGTIVERFDNVATAEELEGAVARHAGRA